MNLAKRILLFLVALAVAITLFGSFWNLQLRGKGLTRDEAYALSVLRALEPMNEEMTPTETERMIELENESSRVKWKPRLFIKGENTKKPITAVILGLVVPLILVSGAIGGHKLMAELSERNRMFPEKKKVLGKDGITISHIDVPFYDLWCLAWKIFAIHLCIAIPIAAIYIGFTAFALFHR